MGWFWAEPLPATPVAPHPVTSKDAVPPPGCPMHSKASPTTSIPQSSSNSQSASACPYFPPSSSGATTPSATQRSSPPSTIAAMAGQPASANAPSSSKSSWNPLNNMFSDLSQSRESASQTMTLPVDRETSSIPRGGASSDPQGPNWVYPSPQQMYNALVRKGYTDTPQDAMESMVAVHNFLNEGAWAEIVEWERRFSRGLMHGWQASKFGEDGSLTGAMIAPSDEDDVEEQPRLLRFIGRSDDMTPKASMLQFMGRVYPSRFAGPPPFDRHDWFVERRGWTGAPREVRYVIDYYSGPPEPTGEPVFYLDIRPALDRPGAVMERFIRSSRDLWWRASGGSARWESSQNKVS